jgi:predicted choloylglycine hydrolase
MMNGRMFLCTRGFLLTLALVGIPSVGLTEDKDARKNALTQERVIAGGSKDFLEVRHLVLKGSNVEIGKALATLARERYQLKPVSSADPFRTRVQRRYLAKHYPILLERMRGAASVFDRPVDDDAFNFSGLWYSSAIKPGCSVVHFPPGMTADGSGIVSRDYDFSTGTLMGTRPPRGQLPATSRPYVIEMHPDRGYPSLAVCSYDLLSGVLDGINSEGLTVAVLADDELMDKFPMEPAGDGGVGLGSLQVLRMLLDTCANVEEAKEALLSTKQFYEVIPVHYLIADRHGKAFVWEYSQAHNRENIIENPDKPLITTNFSLHRYLEDKRPPSAKKAKQVCPRYCELVERLEGQTDKLTVDTIKEIHKSVDAVKPSSLLSGRPPGRTLWHALYYPEQRKVQISFYLGDETDTTQPGKVRIRRSDYVEFALPKEKAARD